VFGGVGLGQGFLAGSPNGGDGWGVAGVKFLEHIGVVRHWAILRGGQLIEIWSASLGSDFCRVTRASPARCDGLVGESVLGCDG